MISLINAIFMYQRMAELKKTILVVCTLILIFEVEG